MATFYESEPIEEAPFLELPTFQYGSLGMPGPPHFRRNNYTIAETLRPFLWANYAPMLYVLPRTALLNQVSPAGILAFQQFEDRAQVPPGTFILGWSAFSAQAAGFRFQIFDEGAKDYVLTEKWQRSSDADVSNTDEGKPHLLPEAYCVVSPGRLQFKVVNLAAVTNDFGLVIHLAIPKGRPA
jgi:hypothetical protein